MAVIGNNSDSFLHALSDFWIRFFADIGDLRATYEGTTILFGQAYLDLLTTVLNTSVDDAPLFRKEYYTLLAIREDQVTWKQDFNDNAKSRWVFTPPGFPLQSMAALQNKVYKPDAALALDVDFSVENNALAFVADPTDLPPDYFAAKKIDVAIGGTFGATGIGAGFADTWLNLGVKKGDVLVTHPYTAISQGQLNVKDTQTYDIVHVTDDELRLSLDTPAPVFPVGFAQPSVSWWIARANPAGGFDLTLPCTPAKAKGTFGLSKNVEMFEVALWGIDSKVDDFALYQNFGHLVANKGASTEAYRSLVKGLMMLYLYGPAIDRLESALNVVSYLPVIRNDGEVLTSYDDGLNAVWTGAAGTFAGGLFDAGVAVWVSTDVGGFVEITQAIDAQNIGVWRIEEVINTNVVRLQSPAGVLPQAGGVKWEFSKTDLQTVTTTAGSYVYDRRIPLRSDITGWNGTDVITFKAFEVLTTAVRVVDYIKDPTWWHNLPVPLEVLPSRTIQQRLASTQLLKNTIGAEFQGYIGDPGFYIGADENKVIGGIYRHYPAFILMDRFLKTHLFQVKIDRHVKLSSEFVAALTDVVRQAKPAFTYTYLQPGTEFLEVLVPQESFLVEPTRQQFETLSQQAHPLTIGSTPSWTIGQQWHFTGASGWAVTMSAAAGPYMELTIGGLDPQTVPVAQGASTGIREAALYVDPV